MVNLICRSRLLNVRSTLIGSTLDCEVRCLQLTTLEIYVKYLSSYLTLLLFLMCYERPRLAFLKVLTVSGNLKLISSCWLGSDTGILSKRHIIFFDKVSDQCYSKNFVNLDTSFIILQTSNVSVELKSQPYFKL